MHLTKSRAKETQRKHATRSNLKKADDGNNKTINGIKGVKRRSCQNNVIATRPAEAAGNVGDLAADVSLTAEMSEASCSAGAGKTRQRGGLGFICLLNRSGVAAAAAAPPPVGLRVLAW